MKHLLRVGVLIAIWGLCGKGHADLYFPHIAVGINWQSDICVINTSGQKNVIGFLDPYDNDGKRVSQSISINLGPHARQEFPIANVFSNPGSIGYIILVTASEDVCGYTKFFTPGKWRAAVPAVSRVNTGQIYIPHIASNVNWWTGISLLNTTSEQKIATIAFNTGQTLPFSLAAGQHRVFTIRGLLGGQPQPSIQCATITGASGVIGLELFGGMPASGNSYLGGVLLKDAADTQLDYPHIVSSATWWTGLAAYNPSDVPADVTITPYAQSGASLASQSIVINGGANFVANTANMNLPEKTAWLRMESATPLAGLELVFGTLERETDGGLWHRRHRPKGRYLFQAGENRLDGHCLYKCRRQHDRPHPDGIQRQRRKDRRGTIDASGARKSRLPCPRVCSRSQLMPPPTFAIRPANGSSVFN